MRIPSKKKRIQKTLLIDGDSLLKTAYHGAKNLYYKETHIGGIFQFLTMVRKMLNENKFDRVYVFWDGTFSGRLRYDIYKDYKSNRDKDFYNETPPSEIDLYLQKERVISYCEELFIRQYRDDIVDADDSIADYVKNMSEDENVVIMSNDRDLCQLINERVSVYVINLKKIVTEENYLVDFDHHPSNLKLIKTITGDVSLNSKLYVMDDVSFNADTYVGGNLTIDESLIVAGSFQVEDMSVNGNLSVRGGIDASGATVYADNFQFGVVEQFDITVGYQSDFAVSQEYITFSQGFHVIGDVSMNGRTLQF